MPHMQQEEKESPFSNTRHSYSTLFGMPPHVEGSRDQIQRHRPQRHSWTGPNQAFGHTA